MTGARAKACSRILFSLDNSKPIITFFVMLGLERSKPAAHKKEKRMNIFVVVHSVDYEGDSIQTVFFSKEKAEERASALNIEHNNRLGDSERYCVRCIPVEDEPTN